ncbi:hypothetical protein [Pseudomonas kurunegalensis]|uniref:hypothetical protein n=1 Tax=Pseudomonas kurunegalensis TaxID=485880 RepID=UPI00256FB57F|nr:hypothetical protein [Pseudomonas kurunegalensis]WJD64997.1 hypothetical protein QQ992_12055 [Pseudomonas kurunegalensis]
MMSTSEKNIKWLDKFSNIDFSTLIKWLDTFSFGKTLDIKELQNNNTIIYPNEKPLYTVSNFIINAHYFDNKGLVRQLIIQAPSVGAPFEPGTYDLNESSLYSASYQIRELPSHPLVGKMTIKKSEHEAGLFIVLNATVASGVKEHELIVNLGR